MSANIIGHAMWFAYTLNLFNPIQNSANFLHWRTHLAISKGIQRVQSERRKKKTYLEKGKSGLSDVGSCSKLFSPIYV